MSLVFHRRVLCALHGTMFALPMDIERNVHECGLEIAESIEHVFERGFLTHCVFSLHYFSNLTFPNLF